MDRFLFHFLLLGAFLSGIPSAKAEGISCDSLFKSVERAGKNSTSKRIKLAKSFLSLQSARPAEIQRWFSGLKTAQKEQMTLRAHLLADSLKSQSERSGVLDKVLEQEILATVEHLISSMTNTNDAEKLMIMVSVFIEEKLIQPSNAHRYLHDRTIAIMGGENYERWMKKLYLVLRPDTNLPRILGRNMNPEIIGELLQKRGLDNNSDRYKFYRSWLSIGLSRDDSSIESIKEEFALIPNDFSFPYSDDHRYRFSLFMNHFMPYINSPYKREFALKNLNKIFHLELHDEHNANKRGALGYWSLEGRRVFLNFPYLKSEHGLFEGFNRLYHHLKSQKEKYLQEQLELIGQASGPASVHQAHAVAVAKVQVQEEIIMACRKGRVAPAQVKQALKDAGKNSNPFIAEMTSNPLSAPVFNRMMSANAEGLFKTYKSLVSVGATYLMIRPNKGESDEDFEKRRLANTGWTFAMAAVGAFLYLKPDGLGNAVFKKPLDALSPKGVVNPKQFGQGRYAKMWKQLQLPSKLWSNASMETKIFFVDIFFTAVTTPIYAVLYTEFFSTASKDPAESKKDLEELTEKYRSYVKELKKQNPDLVPPDIEEALDSQNHDALMEAFIDQAAQLKVQQASLIDTQNLASENKSTDVTALEIIALGMGLKPATALIGIGVNNVLYSILCGRIPLNPAARLTAMVSLITAQRFSVDAIYWFFRHLMESE